MKKLEIDPRDVSTWNTTSSSHTGGGGSGENNGSDPGGTGSSGGSQNGTIPPDPLIGIGGLSLEEDSEKE